MASSSSSHEPAREAAGLAAAGEAVLPEAGGAAAVREAALLESNAGQAALPAEDLQIVRDAKQPCAYAELGCNSSVAYFAAADHQRGCQWAPCSCPELGCGFFSSPPRLAYHLAGTHSWPVTEVSYGKELRVPLPPPQGWHVLVGEEGQRVFLLSASKLFKTAAAVSLVCVRANGDAADGAPQFRCKLWAEAASCKESMVMMMFMVPSSSMSGAAGAFSAADQGIFLGLPPQILEDVAPVVMVRIDRAGADLPPRSSTSSILEAARLLH